MIKKEYVIGGVLIIIMMLSSILLNHGKVTRPVEITVSKREALALQFLEKEFALSGGVRTTYHDPPYVEAIATSEEVLSESQGLLMLYYALSDNEIKFNKVRDYLNKNLKQDRLYVYREGFSVNALIDDLRIIEALVVASEQFHQPKYLKEAKANAFLLVETNVVDNKWHDFYDINYDMTNDFITLGYLNFEVIDLISTWGDLKFDKSDTLIDIVEDGYLGHEFPIYESRYYYESQSYESDKIHTSEGLLPIFHLAKIGEVKEESIEWLEEKVVSSTLYGSYSPDGISQNEVESTASYAIVAQIGALIGDEKLYEASILQMERFQVLEKNSPLYGGFGDVNTQEAYSFDQLMALLAYRYGDIYLYDKNNGGI